MTTQVQTSHPDQSPPRRFHLLNTRSAVGLIVMGAILARAWNLTGFPAFSDDEGTYVAQAWAVQQGHGLTHYTYTYDHPPVGWIQIATLSWLPRLVVPDLSAVASGRIVMLLFAAATLVLVAVLARRLRFSGPGVVAVTTVCAISPLAISLHRQVLLDNVAVAWMLGALALALSPRRHLWNYIAAGILAAISVLCKETLLLALPALLVAVRQNADPQTRSFAMIGTLCGFLTSMLFYPLYALLNGELLWFGMDRVSLIGAWWYQLVGRTGSGSVFDAGSEAQSVVYGWYLLDGQLLVWGSCAVVAALAVPRLRVPAVAALVPMLVVICRTDGYLPGMLVIQVLPFWVLAAVGLAEVAIDVVRRHDRTARVTVAISVIVVVAIALALPRSTSGWRVALDSRINDAYPQTVSWLKEKVPVSSRARIVTDDVIWLDLVESGYDPKTQILWHYKVDLDEEVRNLMPRGWRDADYIVSSATVRDAAPDLPIVASILENSRPVAVFGEGPDRVEIRAVGTAAPAGSRPDSTKDAHVRS